MRNNNLLAEILRIIHIKKKASFDEILAESGQKEDDVLDAIDVLLEDEEINMKTGFDLREPDNGYNVEYRARGY